MVGKKKVIEILKTVNDPELMIDVWTLGLIYEVMVEKGTVKIKMTFTTPLCPYGPMLLDMIESTIKEEIKSVKEVKITVVFDPPWEPDPDLRAMYGV